MYKTVGIFALNFTVERVPFMKLLRKMFAGLLALAVLCCMFSGLSISTYAASKDNVYYLTPKLGDGASLKGDTSNLYVKGVLYKNGMFIFTETRTLTFTVELESGWSYCPEYSSVFKGDAGHLVVTQGSNSVTFKYTATNGQSISFSSLKNICINTTVDQMPKMYISVQGNFDNVDKDSWVDCEISMKLGTKKYTSGNFEGAAQIKGRGQSSWAKDQKPYSINFEKKTSLLDIPATKKYAIVSTYQDHSLIRNIITYQTSQGLSGIDYVVKAELVEVYLNGEYNGVYTLCERARISKTQIDDEEATPENINGAYLLEKTVTGKMYSINGSYVDQYFAAPYIGHPEGNKLPCDTFVFKDPDEVNQAMIDHCESIINDVHTAVMSNSDTLYTQYIDVDSWVDFIIMQEVAKNVDADLKTSTLMYIPSNSRKLAFTSLWDFDISYGNASHNNDGSGHGIAISGTPNADTPTKFMTIANSNPWFVSLYKKDSFKQAIKEKYTEYRYTVLQDLINNIDYYSAYLYKTAQTMDIHEMDARVIQKEVEDLKKWLDLRLEWLDSQWLLDDFDPYKISVSVAGEGSVVSTDGKNTYRDGGYKEYTVSPAEGYSLSKVTFNGKDVTSQLKLGTYTTPYLTESGKLVVTFKKEDVIPAPANKYNVYTDSAVQNGKIEVSSVLAENGEIITVAAIPDEGYILKSISVDGTVLSGNTFVMPANDVIVSAEFEEVVLTDKNREVLMEAIRVASSAKAGATANLSCKAISDTYNSFIANGDMIYNNEEATAEQIDAASFGIVRIVGILYRDEISKDELAVLVKVAELYSVDGSKISAANSAVSSGDKSKIIAEWDNLVDAVSGESTKVLLESITEFYAAEKAENYSEETFAVLTSKIEAARTVLNNSSAKQSEIDKATAELSYAGRHLKKTNLQGQGNSGDEANGSSLTMAVKILSIVLAVLAVCFAGFTVFKLVSRKRA